MFSKRTAFIFTLLLGMLLTGCRGSGQGSPSASTRAASGQTAAGQAAVTFTPFPAATTPAPTPTVTPEPLAIKVNGDGISIAEYQAEQRQLQEALQTLKKEVSVEQQRKQVQDNLIDTQLLAQGALEAGFKVDDAAVQAEVDRLTQQLGGAKAVEDWMAARGYDAASFRAALKRSLAAAWQRDQLIAAVPTEAEQVHARQILTLDENIAQKALDYVKIPGTNFAAYAYRYDAQTGGDLGWFPRGYLTQPEVEEAVFQLQPGEISPVIKSAIGYHILQVISREPSRLISPDARRVLQHKALSDWLKARRAAGKIEILQP